MAASNKIVSYVLKKLRYASEEEAKLLMGKRNWERALEQERFNLSGGVEAQASAGKNMPDIDPGYQRSVKSKNLPALIEPPGKLVPISVPPTGKAQEIPGHKKFSAGDPDPSKTVRTGDDVIYAGSAKSNLPVLWERPGVPAIHRTLRESNIGGKALGIGLGAGGVATLSGDNRIQSVPRLDEGANFNGSEPAAGFYSEEPVVGKPAAAYREDDYGRGDNTLRRSIASGGNRGGEQQPPPPPPEKEYKQTPVSDKELRAATSEYIDSLRNFAPEKADTSAVDAEVKALRDEYKQARSQNEKNELYQLIASSIAKLGAYKWGMEHGQVIGDKLDIPTIDYGKRTDQSFKEMGAGLDEAGSRRRTLEESVRESNRLALDKLNRGGERKVATEDTIYKQKTDRAQDLDRYNREKEQGLTRYNREVELQKMKPGEESKQSALLRAEGAKQVSDTTVAIEKEGRKLNSILTAIALLRSKKADKADQALSSAGLDDQTLDDIDTASRKGEWWGTDNEKKADYIQKTLLPQAQQNYNQLKEDKKAAIALRQTGLDIPSVPRAVAQSATVSREQLQEYMNTHRMTEASARSYLQSQGFQVE